MRTKIALYTTVMLLTIMAADARALEVPPYEGYVTDVAGMMNPQTRQAIAAHLAELDKTDSTQIAVLTIPSLEGESIQEFGIKVADAWKVGQNKEDNGAILLVSKADRKIRIEVGYGLEGVLTDAVAGQIVANVIGPSFKKGDFDGGFAQGITAMTNAVKGEYTAAPTKQTRRSKRGALSLIIIPMIMFIAFTEMFGRRRRPQKLTKEQLLKGEQGHHRSGMGSAASSLFLLSMLGGGFRGGGGGGFGDGGGFGGFGGGGFGGGGAGGDW